MVAGQGGDSEGGERRLDLMRTCQQFLLPPVEPCVNMRGESLLLLRRSNSVSFRVFHCFSSVFSPRTLSQ